MSDIPLPEPMFTLAFPDDDELVFTSRQMREYAAAQSIADNAALRAELARLKTVPMKYRRMEFNAQLQAENAALRERVKVLEDALRRVRNDKSFNCLKIEKTQQYIIAALGDTPC